MSEFRAKHLPMNEPRPILTLLQLCARLKDNSGKIVPGTTCALGAGHCWSGERVSSVSPFQPVLTPLSVAVNGGRAVNLTSYEQGGVVA